MSNQNKNLINPKNQLKSQLSKSNFSEQMLIQLKQQNQANYKLVNNVINEITDIYSSKELNNCIDKLQNIEDRKLFIDKIIQRQAEIQQLQLEIRLNNMRPQIHKFQNKKLFKQTQQVEIPGDPKQYKKQMINLLKNENKNKEKLKYKRNTILRFEAQKLAKDLQENDQQQNDQDNRKKSQSINSNKNQYQFSSMNLDRKLKQQKTSLGLTSPEIEKKQNQIIQSIKKREEEREIKEINVANEEEKQSDSESHSVSVSLNTQNSQKQKQVFEVNEDPTIRKKVIDKFDKCIRNGNSNKQSNEKQKEKLEQNNFQTPHKTLNEQQQQIAQSMKLFDYSKNSIMQQSQSAEKQFQQALFIKQKQPFKVNKDIFPQNRMKKIRKQIYNKLKNQPLLEDRLNIQDQVAYEIYKANKINSKLSDISSLKQKQVLNHSQQQQTHSNANIEQKKDQSLMNEIDNTASQRLKYFFEKQQSIQNKFKTKYYLANSLYYLNDQQQKKENELENNQQLEKDPFNLLVIENQYNKQQDYYEIQQQLHDKNNSNFIQKLKNLNKHKNFSQQQKTLHLLYTSSTDERANKFKDKRKEAIINKFFSPKVNKQICEKRLKHEKPNFQEDSFISIYEMKLTGLYKETSEIKKNIENLQLAKQLETSKEKRKNYKKALFRQQELLEANNKQLQEIIQNKLTSNNRVLE